MKTLITLLLLSFSTNALAALPFNHKRLENTLYKVQVKFLGSNKVYKDLLTIDKHIETQATSATSNTHTFKGTFTVPGNFSVPIKFKVHQALTSNTCEFQLKAVENGNEFDFQFKDGTYMGRMKCTGSIYNNKTGETIGSFKALKLNGY